MFEDILKGNLLIKREGFYTDPIWIFEVFKVKKYIVTFIRGKGYKSSDMRFAIERLSAAPMSKPNSLLHPLPLMKG